MDFSGLGDFYSPLSSLEHAKAKVRETWRDGVATSYDTMNDGVVRNAQEACALFKTAENAMRDVMNHYNEGDVEEHMARLVSMASEV